MKAFVRLGIAGTAALMAVAPAQLNAQDVAEPAPAATNAVGPAQLRDFSLEGTIIRQAEPPQQRRDTATESRQQTSAASTVQAARPEPARAQAQSAPTTSQRSAERDVDRTGTAPAPVATAATRTSRPSSLPPPSPADPLFSPAPVLPSSSSSAPYAPLEAYPDSDSGLSPIPWLLALLLLGAGGFYYFRRPRSPLALAGGGEASAFVAPDRQPEPPRAQPAPPPAPAPPRPSPPSGGIVSTRLRPWLDVRFEAQSLSVDAENVTLEFGLLVTNSGSGPARDILVEALMFSAGPDQDKQVGAFFARPVGKGDRAELLDPLKSMGFKSAVTLRQDQLLRYQAGDRTVVIPIIGLNVLYRGGSSSCQTSVAFLIGKKTRTEKLGPFVVDAEPRTHAGLACRELEVGVRK